MGTRQSHFPERLLREGFFVASLLFFFFLLVDLALSLNWSLFLAVLIAILLSPARRRAPSTHPFAVFSLVGTFFDLFYSELSLPPLPTLGPSSTRSLFPSPLGPRFCPFL